jgi:heme exporter protein C
MPIRLKAFATVLPLVVALMCAAAHWMIFVVAPREATMGEVQRIVYLHVAVAWCGLAGCIAMGGSAVMYLLRRTHVWDQWSQASAELGWLCTTLTLATGSLWAHEAWNTWWTWEPRLTSSLILWMLFAGYFLVRSSLDDTQHRARVSAV